MQLLRQGGGEAETGVIGWMAEHYHGFDAELGAVAEAGANERRSHALALPARQHGKWRQRRTGYLAVHRGDGQTAEHDVSHHMAVAYGAQCRHELAIVAQALY